MNTKMSIITEQLSKRGIDESLWSAIGSSIFPGASDESKLLAFDYCKARGLDIMKKPCHVVPMNVKDAKTGAYGWRDVIMPGIAEARITATRTGGYAGQDAPIFGESVEMTFGKTKHTVPEYCTVTIYRIIGGLRVGTSHTEYFEEACATTKDGELNSMWTKRKRGQLAKCAEAGALRKAFPEEMGGIITADEADNGESMRNVTTKPANLPATTADEVIDPFAKPAAVMVESTPEPIVESDPEPQPEQPKRERKELIQRDAIFRKLEKKETKTGKPYWVVSVSINGKSLNFTTFSSTVAEKLEWLDDGTQIKIELKQGAKPDQFSIETCEVIGKEVAK